MKIAQVCPYDHLTPGGVREHVVNLTRALTAAGHHVNIIAPAPRPEHLRPHVICVSTSVVPVRINGSIARVSLSPQVFGRMRRVLTEGRFDVVHVHEPLVPVVSLFAVLTSPAATIGHFHGYRERYALYELGREILRTVLARLDARVAVSKAACRGARLYFPGKYGIIPDGVDAARFGDPAVQRVARFDDGKLNILFVGRADPRKGLPILLEAFPLVKAQVPGARLIVAGAYSEQEIAPLAEQVRRGGVADVEFVGRVSEADLPRLYRTAHVFCAPSTRSESLGIILLEAMAAGTPIVASDIEGYHTALTEGAEGIFVAPGDCAALAQGLIRLLQDPGLRQRMGLQGKATARRFDWAEVARLTIQTYERCLERRRGPARALEAA